MMQGNNSGYFEEPCTALVTSDAHSPQEIQAAYFSRKQGFEYINKSYFGRALAHFFVALQLIPEWRQELRSVFWQALCGGCKQLSDEGRLSETVELRKNALLLYPDDEIILLDLGSVFYKLNDIDQALQHYELALRVNPSLLLASRAIQSIHNKVVERWHFRMLNDAKRNTAYHQAISYRVHQGHNTVLDVGTGTGLLSLFAVREGAIELWACESNKYMFNVAQTVLSVNSVSEKVNLINKSSLTLSVPTDIPKKVSMVVTEVFDAGLLGEGVLETLTHAWKYLLLPSSNQSDLQETNRDKKHGVVIPFSATVYIAAIQCIDISRRHRLLPETCMCKNDLDSNKRTSPYFDFDKTKICKFCEAPTYRGEDSSKEITTHLEDRFVAADSAEPYTSEDLENIPFGYSFLSQPSKVLDINFNREEDLLEYGYSSLKETVASLKIHSAGCVDAIASWFHLNLDDNGTVITTAPFEESGLFRGVCWHQAIFPSFVPRAVKPGDSMSISVDTWGGVLKVCERGVDLWPLKVKESKQLLARSQCAPMSVPVLFVSENIVAFLNNKTWVKALNITAAELIQHFSTISISSKTILDLNPFPVLGLGMLKRGDSSWKLIAKAESKTDEEFIKAVAKRNSICVEQIQFVTADALETLVKNVKVDVINLNVVDSSGEIAENLTELIPVLMKMLTSHGVVIPHSLSIECQLIQSAKLEQDSRVVSDESLGNFHIKNVINTYAVDYHLHVVPHGQQLRKLSERFEVTKVQLNPSEEGNICDEHKGETFIYSTGIGTVTGAMYWWNLYLRPGSTPVSTLGSDSHCNQATLFSSINVTPGMKLTGKYQLCYGLFDIKLSGAQH